MVFTDEQSLVRRFLEHIRDVSCPWGDIRVRPEFFYNRGRTDLVAVSEDGKVIAFEAKLKKWKSALHQAYRNKCFADFSYVILPEKCASCASQYSGEFARRGVGLCFVSENDLRIIHEATESAPLQPWLHDKAFSYACEPAESICTF